MIETRLIDTVPTVCPVATTNLCNLTGLAKFYRRLQLGLEVTAGTAAHVTTVNVYRGTGPHPAIDTARSAAALAALAAGLKYDLAVDEGDVLDALKVDVIVGTAPVTITTTLLAGTLS